MMLPSLPNLCCLWRTVAALLVALVLAGAAPGQPPPEAPAALPPLDQPEQPPEESKKNAPEEKPEGPEAANMAAAAKEGPKEEWYSIHGQGTVVSQGNWKFRSPYEGQNSFLPLLNYRTTETSTLYLDTRLWQGAELVFNPEVAGGTGLSRTLGLAGFPNGEATRIGLIQPTPYFARLFLRQTIGLGGDDEKVESGPNQLAGYRDIDRITVSVGKFAATDFFDDNRYSHDPRTQFLNWSLMYNGAWDYPANVRGYTYGGAIDFNTRYLALHYGVFAEPTVAQGAEFDPHFLKANGHIVQADERYDIDGHPGTLREWAFLNHAHMGNYREALAEMPVNPDVTLTRAYRIKYGFGLSWDQELTKDLGVFVRAGWDDGQSESWAFTEIDRTLAAGLSLLGTAWRRPQDTLGLAFVANGLANAHKDYLAAGGIGFQIGDGRLHYGPEEILEAYYNWQPREWLGVAADFQGVANPAYNQDRGPVAIFAIRVHMAF
jgi:high affinity Mn2+ porin